MRDKRCYLICTFLLSFFFLFFFSFELVSAAKAEESSSNSAVLEVQNKIKEYEEKLSKIRTEKNTLSSQISYMNTQIRLTTLRIQSTSEEISRTEDEIKLLDERIGNLDKYIDVLSRLLLVRIVEGYKKKPGTIFSLLLNTDHASELMKEIKYIQVVQENNQMLLIQVQRSKLNFEEQKDIRQKKQEKLKRLQVILEKEKVELKRQKEAKENLLRVTHNSELVYQRLLEAARKQLAGFKSFVKRRGGGVIGANAFGSGKDGWYYSQRDERWAYTKIGNSNEVILNVGCLITDVAMVLKSKGVNWTPADVALNSSYFFSNTAYLNRGISLPNGLVLRDVSTSKIQEYLKQKEPVIVGIYAGNYGTHFVTLKGMDGDDYIMNDPYYGPDKNFSKFYSKGSIYEAKVIK